MSCGNSSSREGKSRKIIIPKGSIHPNETVVIEIPSRLRNNSTVLARRRSSPCPGGYATPPFQPPTPTPPATPTPSVSGGQPQFVMSPRSQQNSYGNQTYCTSKPGNLTYEEPCSGAPPGSYGGTPKNDSSLVRDNRMHYLGTTPQNPEQAYKNFVSCSSNTSTPIPKSPRDLYNPDPTFYPLGVTPKRASSLVGTMYSLGGTPKRDTFLYAEGTSPQYPRANYPPDTTFHSLGGTPKRGESLVGDNTMHSLGGTPDRNTFLYAEGTSPQYPRVNYPPDTTFYSLGGTPKRGESLVDDNTMHSLGGTPDRNTFLYAEGTSPQYPRVNYPPDTTFYSLGGTPKRGESLVGDNTMHSLGGTPKRDTFMYAEGTSPPTPQYPGVYYPPDTAFYSLGGTPKRVDDSTMYSLGGTPDRDTFLYAENTSPQYPRVNYPPDTTFYSLGGTPKRGESLVGDNTMHSLGGTPETVLFDEARSPEASRVFYNPATSFYSLGGTPKVDDSRMYRTGRTPRRGLYDEAYNNFVSCSTETSTPLPRYPLSDTSGGTPNRNSYLVGDNTMYSLGGTPERRIALYPEARSPSPPFPQCPRVYYPPDTSFYSLGGTPRRDASLVGDYTFHSLGGTPDRGGEPASYSNTSQGSNATYTCNPSSPLIRRVDKSDVPFQPPFASTPMKGDRGECKPFGNRNVSAPVAPVTSPPSPFYGNESYAGYPTNFNSYNPMYHHVSVGPQMSPIYKSLAPNSNVSCSSVYTDDFTPDTESSSGEMDTSLFMKVIRGDVGRVIVPCSPVTPKDATYNRGDLTYNTDNRNATYNRANLTYNANVTYNPNLTYPRGNGQGLPPGQNATYSCNQSPFIRRKDNSEVPFQPPYASTPTRGERSSSAPCGVRNVSAPVPRGTTPDSYYVNYHETYGGYPGNFKPSKYPYNVPTGEYVSPVAKERTYNSNISSIDSFDTFPDEFTEDFESSGEMDTDLLMKVVRGDVGRVLVPSSPANMTFTRHNRDHLITYNKGADQLNETYTQPCSRNDQTYNYECPSSSTSMETRGQDELYDSSEGDVCLRKAVADRMGRTAIWPTPPGNATFAISPCGLNQTYPKNVTFGPYNKPQNQTRTVIPSCASSESQKGNCARNSQTSVNSFSSNANSSTIGDTACNKTFKKVTKRRRKVVTPQKKERSGSCSCNSKQSSCQGTDSEADAVELQRMEAAENTMLQENLRNWQDARRRLIVDAAKLTTSNSNTSAKDSACCK